MVGVSTAFYCIANAICAQQTAITLTHKTYGIPAFHKKNRSKSVAVTPVLRAIMDTLLKIKYAASSI